MAETETLPVNERIKDALDGRTNKWLRGKLSERDIILTDSQISQRLSGKAEFTGDEAIACFEILKIEILNGLKLNG